LFGGVIGAGLVAAVYSWVENRHTEAVTKFTTEIDKLYQPFYTLSLANDVAWCGFVHGAWRPTKTKHLNCKDKVGYWDAPNLPAPEAERWRTAMTVVFQPSNIAMERLILDHADLLVTRDPPPKWQDFQEHVDGYKLLIAEWKADDREKRPNQFISKKSNVFDAKPYPQGLTACAADLLETILEERDSIQASLFRSWTSGREKQTPASCRD
jgi:hypothetical protein